MNTPQPPPADLPADRPSSTGSGWDAGVDIITPNAARIYDFLLGGCHNFAADRVLAQQAITAVPDLPVQAHTNRAVLSRIVAHLSRLGVRQFIDIGSGIPTVGTVHDIAHRHAPEARVVYVDNDPVVVAHSQHLLAGDPRTATIHADLRDPHHLLNHQDLTKLLDLTRPVAVLLIAVLHFIPDHDHPTTLIRRLRDAVCPGSYLAIGHGVRDARPADAGRLAALWDRTRTPLTLRTRPDITAMFTGLDLLPPGLVWAPQWRPGHSEPVTQPDRSANLVGVGHKS